MGKWSGLAPAVDAHLRRWTLMERAQGEVDQVFKRHQGKRNSDRNIAIGLAKLMMTNDVIGRWMQFATSYGLPDDRGVPQNSILLVPRDQQSADADIEGAVGKAQATIAEGGTITGREQPPEFTEHTLNTGSLMIARELLMLRQAVSHYISAEVIDEVTWAAEESFPEPLFDTDLFTPAGFAVLEKVVNVPDLDVETGLPRDDIHVQVRAIGWQRHGHIRSPKDGATGEGITLFLYSTPDDYAQGYVEEAKRAYPHLSPPAVPTDLSGDFFVLEVIPWRFGAEWSTKPDTEVKHIPGTVPSPVAFQRRWFFALMRLCWQEIIVRRRQEREITRAERRRWEHLAKRKELLDYTTLRLRRVVDPFYKPQSEGLPLDHRVLVRAHWRRQWVQSLGPARLPDGTMDPTTHRLIWIEQHWRGPDDAPIGAMHSGTSVVR